MMLHAPKDIQDDFRLRKASKTWCRLVRAQGAAVHNTLSKSYVGMWMQSGASHIRRAELSNVVIGLQ